MSVQSLVYDKANACRCNVLHEHGWFTCPCYAHVKVSLNRKVHALMPLCPRTAAGLYLLETADEAGTKDKKATLLRHAYQVSFGSLECVGWEVGTIVVAVSYLQHWILTLHPISHGCIHSNKPAIFFSFFLCGKCGLLIGFRLKLIPQKKVKT